MTFEHPDYVHACRCRSCASRREHNCTLPTSLVSLDIFSPDCPCHLCRGARGTSSSNPNAATAARETSSSNQNEATAGKDINPVLVAKGVGIIIAFVVVVKIVQAIVSFFESLASWFSAHIGGILLTVAICGALAGGSWYLLNRKSPLRRWLKERRERIEEEDEEEPLALPPPRTKSLPPPQKKGLNPTTIRVIGVTTNPPQPVPQKRK